MAGAAAAEDSGLGGSIPLRLLSDKRLVRLAAQGSRGAFAEIFRRFHQPLYRYAKSILGDEADASDAVQAAMVRLLDSLPGEEREIALKPWLYRIVHNEAISIIRGRRTEPETIREEPSVELEDAALRLRTRELLADLSRLPDRQRSAVVLRELSGLSHKEIGLALQTSPEAAKQAVYEGRLALQQAEEGREMDCSVAREAISAQDRRILRGRKIRAHLRGCPDCRDFETAIGRRRTGLAALAPLPLGASKEMLEAILGSGGGPAGGLGLLGAAGTAKAILGGGGAAQIAAGAAVIAAGAGVAITSGTPGTSDGAGERRDAPPPPVVTAVEAASAAPSVDGGRSTAGGRGRTAGANGERAGGRFVAQGRGRAKGRGEKGKAGQDGRGPDPQGVEPGAPGSGQGGRPSSPPGHEIAAQNKPDTAGKSEGNSQGVTPPGIGKPPGAPATPPAPASKPNGSQPAPTTPPVAGGKPAELPGLGKGRD